MKTTTKTTNLTQQFASEGAFLNAIMEFKAYERGWGPVPSATSMTILAEQRGSAYASSHSATVRPGTTSQEPHRAKKYPAPTLRVVMPSSPSSATKVSSPIPTINVGPPTPTTRCSPLHTSYTEEEMPAYTLTSYYDLARRAPLTERVPYLPQFCPHSVRPFVPPHMSGCQLCARQLVACDTWFSWSSASMSESRAPAVLPAACTVEMRSIYYALGIPLGKLDRSCVDQDIVKSIIIPRRTAALCCSHKESAVRCSSRMRALFNRARHVFGAPSRAPMMFTR